MTTPRVIGLDLSLTSTGLAGPGWTATLKPGDRRGADRLSWIRAELLDKYLNGLDLVVVEGPSYGSKGAGQHERAGLWWLIRVALHHRGHPVAVVPPTSLKKYATGSGRADKDDIVREVTRRFSWFAGKNDEADALVLAAMGADHLGQPIADMPQTHRAALTAVSWPTTA